MGDSSGPYGVGIYCEHRETSFEICEGLYCWIKYTYIKHSECLDERDLIRVLITDDKGNETDYVNDDMFWIFRIANAEKFPQNSIYGIILDQEAEDNYSIKHTFYL